MRVLGAVLMGGLALAGPATAQRDHGSHGAAGAGGHDDRPLEERARARWPQPVRVGDLAGRQLLEDRPQQTVLGRVAGVVRGTDGRLSVLVDRGGVLGLGTTRVAVPVEATALLGPFLVLVELDRAAFAALPEVAGTAGAALPAADTVRIGLTRN